MIAILLWMEMGIVVISYVPVCISEVLYTCVACLYTCIYMYMCVQMSVYIVLCVRLKLWTQGGAVVVWTQWKHWTL